MKQILMLVLSCIVVVFILAGNYFESKAPVYAKSLEDLKEDLKDSKTTISMVNWIETDVEPLMANLPSKKVAQEELLNYHEYIKTFLYNDVVSLDNENKEYVSMNISTSIYRNDVKSMLNLFRLKMDNGYIHIKEFKIEPMYVKANIELVKFYKD